jgi:heme/copper-type cytochrome/quinol oxidase subunit 4
MWLSDKSMSIITIAITISLVAIVIVVVGGSMIIMPPINAQQI